MKLENKWTQTQMQSHLLTSMSQQPQDKNEHTTSEQQGKDPEEVQKPPLTEEKVEQESAAETTEKVKLHWKNYTDTLNISLIFVGKIYTKLQSK